MFRSTGLSMASSLASWASALLPGSKFAARLSCEMNGWRALCVWWGEQK